MRDLSLHILDIVENSIEAGAKRIDISIDEDVKKNLFILKIRDDGKGMDKKTLAKVLDPFYTTKKSKSIGLGLSMLAQSTREAEGKFDIKSKKTKGTTVTAEFKYDHIDRRPLGNIVDTIIALLATESQDVDIVYTHKKEERSYTFDTRMLKKRLNGIPINNAQVLNCLGRIIRKELKNIGVLT